jgi:serine/threonine protein kinase
VRLLCEERDFRYVADRTTETESPEKQTRPTGAYGATHSHVQGMRLVGSVVGDRFLIKAHLGKGRAGELYEAVDLSPADSQTRRKRSVVLHLLNARVAQQTQLLLKLETSYLQPHSWTHPNVVSAVGFGRDRDEFFFVTEALEGGTLRKILEQMSPGVPSEEETLSILGGVGGALQYAHAKGVVHGELRLESVFVTTDLVVKVRDLLPVTLPRMLPSFPEDTSSNGVAAPDPRDDVYGLACVAYELFAGKHPFNSNSALEASSAGLTPAPIPRLSARSQAALARGLALRREQRTATVAAFLAALGVTGRERLRLGGEANGDRAAAARPHGATRTPAPAPMSASAEVGAERGRSARAKNSQTGDGLDLFYMRGYEEPPKKTGRRWIFWVVALAIAAGAVYWNYDSLQLRGEEWLARAQNFADEAQRRRESMWNAEREASLARADATRRAAPIPTIPDVPAAGSAPTLLSGSAPSAVPGPNVPGSQLPDPAGGTRSRAALPQPTAPAASAAKPPAAPAAKPPVPQPTAPAARQVVPPPAALAARQVVPPPAAPAAKEPAPETFEPETPVVVVSERAPSAAITVRRRGDAQASSSIVWWTTGGTAVGGDDYADAGARIERFAAGELTRTIHIPIVHDSKREGRENFYVNLRPGQSGKNEPPQRVEVVIEDDD